MEQELKYDEFTHTPQTTQECTWCHQHLSLEEFELTFKKARSKKCIICTEKEKEKNRKYGALCTRCYTHKPMKSFFDPRKPDLQLKHCDWCRSRPPKAIPPTPSQPTLQEFLS